MIRLFCLLAGYIFGLFQSGFLYGKLVNKDIRKYGSGNSGATNTLRVLGVKAGIIVLLGDLLKAILVCLLIRAFLKDKMPEAYPLMMLYGGLGAVLGHNYPFYMGFRGGKGIAVTAAVIICMDYRIALICIVTFLAMVALTRIVSSASLAVCTEFLVFWVILGQLGMEPLKGALLYESYGVVFVIAALAYWRHRTNIIRLLSGTENKISFKKH